MTVAKGGQAGLLEQVLKLAFEQVINVESAVTVDMLADIVMEV